MEKGALDFEVTRHFSEEGGITQQSYNRGDKSILFYEISLNCLSENVNFMSVGSVAPILSELMFQSCHKSIFSYIYGIMCFKLGPWGSK